MELIEKVQRALADEHHVPDAWGTFDSDAQVALLTVVDWLMSPPIEFQSKVAELAAHRIEEDAEDWQLVMGGALALVTMLQEEVA